MRRQAPMTSLAKAIGPLGRSRATLPLYQELQRAYCESAIDSRIVGAGRCAALGTRSGDRFCGVADHRTQGLGWIGRRRTCWCRRQGSQEISSLHASTRTFAMLTSFSEDMRARGRTPRSVWLKRAAGTVTPEEALALRYESRHAGVSLQSNSLRRRCTHGVGIRHHRRHCPTLAGMPSMHPSTRRLEKCWTSPGARVTASCAPYSLTARSGRIVEGQGRRRGPPGRTVGVAARRTRH